jgi:hypothetical protein
MKELIVSDKKVKLCHVCGESVADMVTNRGVRFISSVYHSNGKNVVIIKNSSATEHLCLTIKTNRAKVVT